MVMCGTEISNHPHFWGTFLYKVALPHNNITKYVCKKPPPPPSVKDQSDGICGQLCISVCETKYKTMNKFNLNNLFLK